MNGRHLSRLSLAIGAVASLVGCGSDPTPKAPAPGGLLWIGSDADALVRCSVSKQCGDQATNFGALSSLSVGGGELEHSRSYVRFLMPAFPPGTKVVQAQLELFHGGKQEDGTKDDICLDVARSPGPWKPLEVTWSNQPLSSTIGTETKMSLVSQGWSAADVTAAVVDHVANPENNFGFVVFTPASSQIHKSFDSNSHQSRTDTELGTSPRLLVRVELPASGEVVWPESFEEGTDLPFPNESIEIAEASVGDSWPADWKAASTAPCGP
jgi:hypothetical protein